MRTKTSLDWQIGHHTELAGTPEQWIPSSVPGAVQLDWAKANNWPSHTIGNEFERYTWMENQYWTYQTKLSFDSSEEGKLPFLVVKGIDYQFEIKINNSRVHKQEGMFTSVELNLSELAKDGDTLNITVFPIPRAPHTTPDMERQEASYSCKPASSYGWDWHPRLVPLGIWDEIYLEYRPEAYLSSTEIIPSLDPSLERGTLDLLVDLNTHLNEGTLEVNLLSPDGTSVITESSPLSGDSFRNTFSIDAPQLWWPHDQGSPSLYQVTVTLLDSDGNKLDLYTRKIGFRQTRLVMNRGAWEEPELFPKTRSVPPITLEINGRSIFAKGSNWVNADIFPGVVNRDNLKPLLKLAQEGNMNLLRIWGGGPVNKEAFYDLCDELGIMVWTEFPLACNAYPDDPDYISVLQQEATSIINRIKKHPSNVMWCGGNELFNRWSEMDDQSHALRLLNALCYELDTKTPFIPTAPIMGMAHGHYAFYDPETDKDVFQLFQGAKNTAYTEFGVPSPSSVEVLKSFIPQDELFPPKNGTSWETHHALEAWPALAGAWLCQPIIEKYFGKVESLEALVEHGQFLQSEGYKAVFQEARRQKPYCSMALNWCFNEPWPTAANNSIINWPAKPKPGYYAVAESCRPVLASARIPKFEWRAGEVFEAELWILNDSPQFVPAGTIEAYLEWAEEKVPLLSWDFDTITANENLVGPTARYILPEEYSGLLKITLIVKGQPELNSEYSFITTAQEEEVHSTAPLLNA